MCPMKRCGGTLLADNPLDRESDYSCLSCNHRLEFKQAEMILSKAEKDIRTPNNKFNLIEHMENFLDMQSKLLHPFNYIMVTVWKLPTIFCRDSPTSSHGKKNASVLGCDGCS